MKKGVVGLGVVFILLQIKCEFVFRFGFLLRLNLLGDSGFG